MKLTIIIVHVHHFFVKYKYNLPNSCTSISDIAEIGQYVENKIHVCVL